MRKMVEPDGRFIGYDVKQDNGVKFDFTGDATASCDINFSGHYRRTAAIMDGFKNVQKGPVWKRRTYLLSTSGILVP